MSFISCNKKKDDFIFKFGAQINVLKFFRKNIWL